MRIAAVEFLGVNVTPKTNWCFLLVRTEDGRTGVGECTLMNQEAGLAAEAERLAALERLAANGGAKLKTARAPVAFRETIRGAVVQHARLKRQTGGHGQFADVKLQIAPRPRGSGFHFDEKVVGGAVPKRFIPAVGQAAARKRRRGEGRGEEGRGAW